MKLFFEDEARFGRINNIRKCWSAKGKRPLVKQQLIREYIYAYGSVCPQTGETFSLIMPDSTTNSMQIFINLLAEHYANYRIVLCMDKAGWHTSNQLIFPQNIIGWFLPPYAPELNPVEMVWKRIRANYFNNKTFETIDAVEEILNAALIETYQSKDEIKQLTNYKWMQ